MVAQPHRRHISPQEYLEHEREAEFKSEYDDGVILGMAGASPEHAAITFNIEVALAPHLRREGCRGFSSDLRVRIDTGNRYYYPDFTAVCGTPILESVENVQSLRNPTLIVEVLSPSTERQDRGRKWLAYQNLESLRTYILVQQDRPCAEAYTLNLAARIWEYRKAEGLDATLEMSSPKCTVVLAEIYADVDFQNLEEARVAL